MRSAEQAWELVEQNADLIQKAVENTHHIRGINAQELHSYAFEAAFRAAKNWDPERGRKLTSHLYGAAQRGAIDGMREMGRFYGYRHNMVRVIEIETVADDATDFWERFDDEATTPEVEQYLYFMELIEPLTERQRQIAYLYFVQGWEQWEIGDYFGVSASSISQIKGTLVRKLRRTLPPDYLTRIA